MIRPRYARTIQVRTGAIRFRRGWLGRMVLQVELLEQTVPFVPPAHGEKALVLSERRVWRDADKQDFDHVMRCTRYLPTRRG